jgi:hypothetical protein
MGDKAIGRIKARDGKTYDVMWEPPGGEVYVSYAGVTRVGTASTATEAVRKAEAWLETKIT